MVAVTWGLCLVVLGLGQMVQGVTQNHPSPAPKASCTAYRNVLSDGTVGICAGLIAYDFYLPDGMTQEEMEALAYSQIYANPSTAGLMGLLPPRCSAKFKKLICASVFQKCIMIDPYFLDSSCTTASHPTAICQAGTGLIPSSYCASSPGNTTHLSDGCITGPGFVFGEGNTNYSTIAYLSGYEDRVDLFCQAYNLTWSDTALSCLVAFPISPAKSLCDDLHSGNVTVLQDPTTSLPYLDAACPVISGVFYDMIINILGYAHDLAPSINATTDPAIILELEGKLAQQNCTFPQNIEACGGKVFDLNFLSAFGVLPSCMATVPSEPSIYLFSETLTDETVGYRAESLGALVQGKAGALELYYGNYACRVVGATAPLCSDVYSSVVANSDIIEPIIEPSFGYVSDFETAKTVEADMTTVGMSEVCKEVLLDSRNQPTNPSDLAIIAGAGGKSEAADGMGAFFVPAALGLPPFPHRFGFTGTDESSPYATFTEQTTTSAPLCVTGSVRGRNSLECLLNQVNEGVNMLPAWVNPKCRIALLDMICASGHLKPQINRLCLVPEAFGGCAETDVAAAIQGKHQIPMIFALPRFASKDMCLAANDACQSFVTYLEETNPTSATALKGALNCDQTIDITCAQNPVWESSVWPKATACSSSLNGAPMYPDGQATVGNLGPLGEFLTNYAAGLALNQIPLASDSFASLFVTTTVNATISTANDSALLATCQCPAPLVVPSKLPAPGSATEMLCCNDVCTTSMFPPETFQFFYNLQFYLSIPSLICATFVFITFLTFKAKRKQRLTLYFSLTSMLIACVFLISNSKPKATDVWCEDETDPIVQKDGGLCVFQAVAICFLVIAACGWWWCQALDLFLRIGLGKSNLESNFLLYHSISWGVAIIVVAIFSGTDTYGYEPGNPLCFASPTGIPDLEFYAYYAIITFYSFTGTIMMVFVLRKIFSIAAKGQELTQNKQTTMKRFVTYRTPVLFVAFFLFVWSVIYGWRFQVEAQENSITKAATLWIECLLLNAANGIADPATDPSANSSLVAEWVAPNKGCGANYPIQVSISAMVAANVIGFFQGFWLFCLFGVRTEVYHLWAERLSLTSRRYDTTDTSQNKKGIGSAGSNVVTPRKRDKTEIGSAIQTPEV